MYMTDWVTMQMMNLLRSPYPIHMDPVLTEHEAARWLTKDELNEVNWLPADIKVVEAILRRHTTFT